MGDYYYFLNKYLIYYTQNLLDILKNDFYLLEISCD